jgi:hypothetical protein
MRLGGVDAGCFVPNLLPARFDFGGVIAGLLFRRGDGLAYLFHITTYCSEGVNYLLRSEKRRYPAGMTRKVAGRTSY